MLLSRWVPLTMSFFVSLATQNMELDAFFSVSTVQSLKVYILDKFNKIGDWQFEQEKIMKKQSNDDVDDAGGYYAANSYHPVDTGTRSPQCAISIVAL